MKPLGSVRLVNRDVVTGGGYTERAMWEISCPAHVMVRIKRTFERISKLQLGSVTMLDTPENCRELEWFLQRFPMEVSDPAHLHEQARKYDADIACIQSILADNYTAPQYDLRYPLRDYQAKGATLLLQRGGLLLNDALGLGKTVTAIGAMTQPRALPALVVTLSHLQIQWESEVKRFLPGLKVHIIKKMKPYDLKVGEGLFAGFPDVIITTYHKLHSWAETLAPFVRYVVYDEIQELRTGDGYKYAGARHISESCDYRMGLSWTPFYNYGGELYNILEVLEPDALGTQAEFHREWCLNEYGKHSIKEPSVFSSYLKDRGLLLMRSRADVGRELPTIPPSVQIVDADEKFVGKEETAAISLAKIIMEQGATAKGAKFRAAGDFDAKMRQATGIAKAPGVAAFVRLLLEGGEKVLLYGWHHEVYKIWKEELKDFNPVMFTGAQSPAEKEEAKRKFLSDESQVMIMSLRSGQGTDGLQKVCRVAVIGELDWSPGVLEQDIGRLERDGCHPDGILVYYLICEFGSDPVMADTLGLKRAQMDGFRNGIGDTGEARLAKSLAKDAENHIKKLAMDVLRRHGISVPGDNDQMDGLAVA